jgi:arginine repressor
MSKYICQINGYKIYKSSGEYEYEARKDGEIEWEEDSFNIMEEWCRCSKE